MQSHTISVTYMQSHTISVSIYILLNIPYELIMHYLTCIFKFPRHREEKFIYYNNIKRSDILSILVLQKSRMEPLIDKETRDRLNDVRKELYVGGFIGFLYGGFFGGIK